MNYINGYHLQWCAALYLPILFFCYYWVKPRYGVFPASLLAYIIISGIWVWVFENNRYVTINAYDQMALRYFSCDSIAKLFLILVPMMAWMERSQKSFIGFGRGIIFIFIYANVLTLIGQFLFTGCKQENSCGGIVGNPSISMGLTVCLLPIVLGVFQRRLVPLLLVALAVILSKSSIAVGLFILCNVLYFLPKKKPIPIACMAAAALLSLGSAYLYLGANLFNSSNRVMIWKFMMQRWLAPWNIPFGTGIGTYHVFSINLQHYGNVAPGSYWNTMHNDWLQGLFELGLMGLFLMVATYIVAIGNMIRAKEKGILISLCLFGLYIGMNPGLHWAYCCLFLAWVFIYALHRSSLQKESFAP
jgi:hypothetical protein